MDITAINTINLLFPFFPFLSAGLFVVVSWVSFLVPPEVVPGRMAMLITLFLLLINIFNTVTTQSPNAEGMNAITAWMLVCMLFVFGALVGYAFLLWRKKKSCLKRHRVRIISIIRAQWVRKSRPKKFVKSNKSISQKIFLTKIHFLLDQKWPKINF